MIRLGLTGSIGMGKSTTAEMFRAQGVPVFDADAVVATLYDKGGAAVPGIAALTPSAVKEGAVDREALRQAVFADKELLPKIEALVHPLTLAAREAFAEQHAGASLAVFDIPLLFETGGAQAMDKILVVTAPPDIQRDRVLARPGMTLERFEAILARQTPDDQKRAQADFILDTSKGLAAAEAEIARIIHDACNRSRGDSDGPA